MINVRDMLEGKMYRVTSDTITVDTERVAFVNLKQDSVVIFLGWKETLVDGRFARRIATSILFNVIVDDRTYWFESGIVSNLDKENLPSDILEAKYTVPWLELARPCLNG